MDLLPLLKDNHFCNWSWRHHLVLTSVCVKKKKKYSIQALVSGLYRICCLTVRSKSRSAAGMAGFIWLHYAQAEAFMAMLLYCNLPMSLLLSEGDFHCCGTGCLLNSATSARCLNGPNAAAERRGRRRKWRSRSIQIRRASLGRRSLLTVVTFRGCWLCWYHHFLYSNDECPWKMCLFVSIWLLLRVGVNRVGLGVVKVEK